MMAYVGRALHEVAPDFQPPASPPWAKFSVDGVLKAKMTEAGFREVEVHTVKRSWQIESTAAFWDKIVSTNPALRYLFESLDDDKRRDGRSLR
jgi:hypothetical protein